MQKRKRYGKQGPSRIYDYQAKEETTLLPLLFAILEPKSRSDIKSMLAHHHVAVNGTPVTQFDMPVTPADVVSINFTRPFAVLRDNQLRIIYEDDWLIAVEKASGLLSVGRAGQDEKTAWRLLTDYMKQKDPRTTAYVCHRLDQYTSGILVFAKDGNVQRELRYKWDYYVRERYYYAVVEGTPEPPQSELRDYLLEDSHMNVHVVPEPQGTNYDRGRGGSDPKLAVTRYQVQQGNGHHSLLDVQLLTGRKNQIRVQLAHAGHPVAGDRKYGATTNPCARLMLHNYRLTLQHPVTHELLRFDLPVPKQFLATTKPTEGTSGL